MSDFGKSNILLTRDSKGKIRQINISCYKSGSSYEITRKSGIVGGKFVDHPKIVIDKGKVKRTLEQQAELEYNSNVKSYLDKGYKLFDTMPDDIEKAVPKTKQDQQGAVKPMLCKQINDIPNKSIFETEIWYASRKINGVRCLMFFKDGKITTRSRGSVSYDIALSNILNNSDLIDFFKRNPTVIFDGEIYHHSANYTLNIISGLCRSKQWVPECANLEFYLYDIVDINKPFTQRLLYINNYSKCLNLPTFDPYRKYNNGDLQIQIVPHERIYGLTNIYKLHDKFVEEGWEGLVIRNADSVYKPGMRTSDWVKVKKYKDAEYEIVGLQPGLRDEDMCFILKTKSGQTFACKPIGSKEQKIQYINNINNLIGKTLTIKYFEMSGVKGSEVPQQPIGICVRDYE